MEKKNKVRTCGNCVHLVKKDRRNYYYYRVYKCMNEDSDYLGSAWKRPSSPTDCPYHEFKNSNHRDVSVGKSTKQIIDKLYGNKEQENKLLDFLENE